MKTCSPAAVRDRHGISSRMRRVSPANARDSRGFALVEAIVGMTLVIMMLGGVFAMNAHLLRILKDGKESAHATQLLQERVEQLRTTLWDQVTTPAKLKTVMEGTPATSVNLPGAIERITVEPTDDATLKVQCDRSATGTVTESGVQISHFQTVKVTMTIKWNSRRGVRERGMITLMTNGGI